MAKAPIVQNMYACEVASSANETAGEYDRSIKNVCSDCEMIDWCCRTAVRRHVQDESLSTEASTASWEITDMDEQAGSAFFRYLRIYQTGPNRCGSTIRVPDLTTHLRDTTKSGCVCMQPSLHVLLVDRVYTQRHAYGAFFLKHLCGFSSACLCESFTGDSAVQHGYIAICPARSQKRASDVTLIMHV
jgi:hypothetical protein